MQTAMLVSGPMLCIAAAPDTPSPAALTATATIILHVAGMLAAGFGAETRTPLSTSCAAATLATGAATAGLSMTAPTAAAYTVAALATGLVIARLGDELYKMMAPKPDGARRRNRSG